MKNSTLSQTVPEFSKGLASARSIESLLDLVFQGLSRLDLPHTCLMVLSKDKKTGTLIQGRKFREEPIPDPIQPEKPMNFNYGKADFQVEDPEDGEIFPIMKTLFYEGKTIVSENIPFENENNGNIEICPLMETTRAFLKGSKWERYSGIIKFPGIMQLLPFKSSIVTPFYGIDNIKGAIELNGTKKLKLNAGHIHVAQLLAEQISRFYKKVQKEEERAKSARP